MKIELEYIVRKKIQIECNSFEEGEEKLLQTNWANGNKLLKRKPEITSRIILNDEISIYNRNDGCHYLKDDVHINTIKRVDSLEEWSELLRQKIQEIQKENPHWKKDKCKFMAKRSMPKLPSDGWM